MPLVSFRHEVVQNDAPKSPPVGPSLRRPRCQSRLSHPRQNRLLRLQRSSLRHVTATHYYRRVPRVV